MVSLFFLGLIPFYTHAALDTIVQELAHTLISPLQRQYAQTILDDPYRNYTAQVRTGNSLCVQERDFIQARTAHVALHLSRHLWQAHQIPRIAIICSGGGCRAMLYVTGALQELQEQGILDLALWLVCLSGSSWAIAPWISSGISLEELEKHLVHASACGWYDTLAPDNWCTIIEQLLIKKYCAQLPITLVDLYGAFLAQRLLDKLPHASKPLRLSHQANLDPRIYPLPIYTSVCISDASGQSVWIEHTPFEMGSHTWQAYIPAWATGRTFNQSISQTLTPEPDLGFWMGVFGSIFAAPFDQMIPSLLMTDSLESHHPWLASLCASSWGKSRIPASCALIPDYCTATQGQPTPYVQVCDAGVDLNIPFPPISIQRPERAADIIICIDASNDIATGRELQKLMRWVQRYEISFPCIDIGHAITHSCSVWHDETCLHAPLFIYLPMINSTQRLDVSACLHSTCNTLNFVYPPETSQALIALARHNIHTHAPDIIQAISAWITRHPSNH